MAGRRRDEVSRVAPSISLDQPLGLGEGRGQAATSGDLPILAAVACGQSLVEGHRELGGHAIVDRPRRGDHGGHACVEQSFHLRARRTAVEEDQLQSALLPQERGEPFGIGRAWLEGRLQEQAVPVGVTPKMENRDAVAMLLKDGVDPLERGLLFDHDVGNHPSLFQLVELVLERPSLDFQ